MLYQLVDPIILGPVGTGIYENFILTFMFYRQIPIVLWHHLTKRKCRIMYHHIEDVISLWSKDSILWKCQTVPMRQSLTKHCRGLNWAFKNHFNQPPCSRIWPQHISELYQFHQANDDNYSCQENFFRGPCKIWIKHLDPNWAIKHHFKQPQKSDYCKNCKIISARSR